nr:MAG TPA: excisionase [Caudoviricetes sp.]
MKLSELTKPEIDSIVGNANFTEEEYQVFQYLCKGTTLDEMVFKLKLSKATISRTVFKIKTKIERIDKMKQNVPVWEKITMTIEEAAEYSSIGINKIRELSSDPRCNFVIYVGKKRLIKRKEFEKFIAENVEL